MFSYKNYAQFSIDASRAKDRIARYINDSKDGKNCFCKVIETLEPVVCIFASKDIELGMELRYDYVESKLPWRRKVVIFQSKISYCRKLTNCQIKTVGFPTAFIYDALF